MAQDEFNRFGKHNHYNIHKGNFIFLNHNETGVLLNQSIFISWYQISNSICLKLSILKSIFCYSFHSYYYHMMGRLANRGDPYELFVPPCRYTSLRFESCLSVVGLVAKQEPQSFMTIHSQTRIPMKGGCMSRGSSSSSEILLTKSKVHKRYKQGVEKHLIWNV